MARIYIRLSPFYHRFMKRPRNPESVLWRKKTRLSRHKYILHQFQENIIENIALSLNALFRAVLSHAPFSAKLEA